MQHTIAFSLSCTQQTSPSQPRSRNVSPLRLFVSVVAAIGLGVALIHFFSDGNPSPSHAFPSHDNDMSVALQHVRLGITNATEPLPTPSPSESRRQLSTNSYTIFALTVIGGSLLSLVCFFTYMCCTCPPGNEPDLSEDNDRTGSVVAPRVIIALDSVESNPGESNTGNETPTESSDQNQNRQN